MNALPTVVLCMGCLAASEPPAAAHEAKPITAVTAPSRDLTLAFVQAGRLAKVLVKEGRKVNSEDLLAQLDDAVERLQVSQLKAKAANKTGIKAAELRLTRKRAVLDKVRKAHSEHAAPERELEDAKLDVGMAELDLEMARFQNAQDEAKYQQAELALQRMRLTSPIAGTVERIFIEAGESVDALKAVARVVRIDPLWIDVPVDIALGRKLKAGGAAAVRFLAEQKLPAARGRIIRVSAVADPASQTLEVRVELPNPTGRPAGEQVAVTFAAPAGGGGSPPAAKGTARSK